MCQAIIRCSQTAGLETGRFRYIRLQASSSHRAHLPSFATAVSTGSKTSQWGIAGGEITVRSTLLIVLLIALASCEDRDTVQGYQALEQHVQKNRVGSSSDQWIEMMGHTGNWEKTGLIFQYDDDLEECEKAIAGMKRVNYAREYRCSPAN